MVVVTLPLIVVRRRFTSTVSLIVWMVVLAGPVGEWREAAVEAAFGRPGAHAAGQAVSRLQGHRDAGPPAPDAQPLADRVLAHSVFPCASISR